MAVTSIWAIKGRVDKAINYARNPEKTREEYHEDLASLHAIDGVVEYAANEMKTEMRCYVTGINCKESTAARQFMDTKKYWERFRNEDRTSGRVCFHGYQSFAAGEVNAEIAHEIGVKLAERLWGDQFEVIVATHCNTGHYHNHFVVNSVSWRDGHKFHNGPEDYGPMKETSDRLCLEYGLSIIEEPSGRGRNYGEFLAEKNGKPTNRSLIREDIDRAIKASVTEQEFFRVMEEMGYRFKIYAESGKPLKYPALKPPGAKGFFRFHKLGENGYTLEEILDRVAANYRRRQPFPEEEQEKAKEYREQVKPKNKEKAKGLHALYIRYCIELHIIKRFPASVKRVSFFMREDLIRLDRLDAQTRFLGEHGIETIENLKAFRWRSEENLQALKRERSSFRNELKRVERAADTEKATAIKRKIEQLSGEMRIVRKDLKLCDGIEERSKQMEEELKALEQNAEKNNEEEVKNDERSFGRRGGTGRTNVPGRD